MGLFNFFKKLTAQVVCDKSLTDKYNWIMLGNKMQKLKLNKEIIVQDNQLCFIRFKDKTCDMLSTGTYQINSQFLPITFNKIPASKINKKLKIKADVYFVKTQNIILDFVFKKQQKINNIKYKESISAQVCFNVYNLKTLTQFLFLENAVVQTQTFNALIYNALYSYIQKHLNNFKGEWADLEDEDISMAIKQKTIKEFFGYGLEITEMLFLSHADCTPNKKEKQYKSQNLESIPQDNLKYNQNEYQSQYSEAMQTGKITITPNND